MLAKCRAALPFVAFIFIKFSLINSAKAQTLPAGFSQVFMGNVTSPTAMAFAPDGRLFILEQAGTVRIFKNGAVLAQPFVTLSVNSSGERGLLGIAFDPSFSTNNFIYLYYTLSSAANNRISRFTANGDVAVAGSEVQILNLDPLSTATNHNGGTMQFGPDGKLYVGVGENAFGANAQNLDTYLGKILRINADGSVPAGNPFTSGSSQKQRLWEYGLRNPYTIAFQPGTGRLFVNDVGQNTWEEINDATVGGKNFGWPDAEGNSSNILYTNPIYAYSHGSGSGQGCAITGGTFFNPPSTNYPALYIGKYFYIDYCNNWIDVLTLSGSTATRSSFATGIAGNPVSIITGNDGNLYFLSRGSSALYKITYTGSQQPVITNQPQSISVSEGNAATFSVTATGATPLSYQWRKNAVIITGATSSTYTISSVSTGSAGNYSVVVSNTAGTVTSNDATLTVTQANQKPTATITIPAAGALYRAGTVINFSGTGTDPEDGTLADASFKWFVVFYHASHTHPGPTAQSAVKSGSFSIPNTGETATNVFYRLYLVVTDSKGAVDTVYTDIKPRLSTITLNTSPQGLQVTLDGQPFTTPLNFLSVEGMQRIIGTPSPQIFQGSRYNFTNWSNAAAQTQTIITATDNIAYTAYFTSATNFTLSPVADAQVRGGIYANTNYGADVEMSTTNTGNPDYNYDSYLRFDLTSLPANNSSVKLRLYGRLSSTNTASVTAQLFNVSSQTWGENTITYSNKPAPQTTVLAADTINGITNAFYEWDITSHINALKKLGATSVSLVIKNFTFTNLNRIIFRSKENTSNRPQLVATVSSTSTLSPVADAQVRGGIYTNTNYGSDVEMSTTNTGNPDYNYDAYLRFDLTSLPANNSSVKLKLYGRLSSTNTASVTAQLFNVTSQTWGENTITYSNKPAPQTTVLAATTINGITNAFYEWDITSHINALKTLGATSVSLVIKNSTFTNLNRIIFRSRENTSNGPQLLATAGAARALPHSINSQVEDNPLQVTIFPNPAKGRFTIVYPAEFNNGILQLFDAYGRLVQQQLLTQINNQIISTANLQNGIYSMLLLKGNKKITKQLIIKK